MVSQTNINNIEQHSRITCEVEYNNYTLTAYNDGTLKASNGNQTFLMVGDLSTFGMTGITNISMRGEVGNREFIVSQGNNEFTLNAEIVFSRFQRIN